MNNVRIMLSLLIVVLCVYGCQKNNPDQSPKTQQTPSITQGASNGSNSAAGVHWNLPERWKPQGERPMRVATYTIPAAQGDADDAECAVFYFGTDQGGDVSSNIARWVQQFENPSKPEEGSLEVNGIKITTVHLTGTYLSPGGPMMQTQGKKENYQLLGAIAEAPEGSVFFKLTGPMNTVNAGKEEFQALIRSIAK